MVHFKKREILSHFARNCQVNVARRVPDLRPRSDWAMTLAGCWPLPRGPGNINDFNITTIKRFWTRGKCRGFLGGASACAYE